MENTVSTTKSKCIRNRLINWYQNDEGSYGVALKSECSSDISNEWEFGKGALNEVISFYWYENLLSIAENFDKNPDEIKPILSKRTEDIKHMCQEAIRCCFL